MKILDTLFMMRLVNLKRMAREEIYPWYIYAEWNFEFNNHRCIFNEMLTEICDEAETTTLMQKGMKD